MDLDQLKAAWPTSDPETKNSLMQPFNQTYRLKRLYRPKAETICR